MEATTPTNNQSDLDGLFRATGMQSFLKQLEREFDEAWENKGNQARVAQNIVILQALRGSMSIKTLAKQSHVHQSQISRFLAGHRKMTFYNLIQIAQVLEVRITTLLNADLAAMLAKGIHIAENTDAQIKM